MKISFGILHPLDIPSVLMEVFKYLDSKDLKKAKLVNKTWQNEANRYLTKIPIQFCAFKRSSLPLYYVKAAKRDRLPTFSDFLSNATSNPNFLLTFQTYIFMEWEANEDWSTFTTLFGPHLQNLTIRAFESREHQNRIYSFRTILKSFPRLTSLSLDVRYWKEIKWREEVKSKSPVLSEDLNLTCLKYLNLVPVGKKMSGHCFTWKGCTDWAAEEFWAILKILVKSAPNLKGLSTTGWNYLPGPIVEEIFKNPAFELESLRLGEFGTTKYTIGPVLEHAQDESIFFEHLTGNSATCKLKALQLPRPDRATPKDWNKLFAWVSSTLVHLDLSRVCEFESKENGDEKSPLGGIEIQTTMNNLRTLDLSMSMLCNSTFAPAVFPNLEKLTLIKEDDWWELSPEEFYRTELTNNLKAMSSVSQLTLYYHPWTRQNCGSLFHIIVANLKNVSSIELKATWHLEQLNSFFKAYDGSCAADKIKSLHIGINVYANHSAITEDITKVFPEMPANAELNDDSPKTLTIFKNLEYLFVEVERDHDWQRITKDFVNNTIVQLVKLKTLKLMRFRIARDAHALLKLRRGLKLTCTRCKYFSVRGKERKYLKYKKVEKVK